MTKTRRSLPTLSLATLALLSVTGCGGTSAPALDNTLFSSVTQAATLGSITAPSSSVPDAAGQFIYFIASGYGGRGVFKVPADGSGAPTAVYFGLPLVQPTDLVLSTDNKTLYVADALASSGGAVFALPIGGGTPTKVAGTEGTAPVAVDLVARAGSDLLSVVGNNTVYEVPVTGGIPTLRHTGAPLRQPTGIVAARDGSLFVADSGTVFRLSGTSVEPLASGIAMGSPAGISLTPDEKSVVVSSRSLSGHSEVLNLSRTTGAQSIFNSVIGVNSNPAGLHAARNAGGITGVYSWADATLVTGGVFKVTFK